MRSVKLLGAWASALAILAVAISSSLALAQPPPVKEPMPRILQNYTPLTWEDLKKPDAGNWLMNRRTYDGWGYSPLDQITTQNVTRLRPVWAASTGEPRAHEAAPLVNNGVMFISTPNNQVMALDVRSGRVLWRYRRVRPAGALVPHETNRGVALYADKVYYAAGEAVLVALDARTGKEVWTAVVADNKSGYYTTLAPLAAGGKIMVGVSGGQMGIRGYVAAFDPDSGKELWRTYTIPAPGEPGSETWPEGDQWKTGGGPVWVAGNYDPDSNLAYFGVGNGCPWAGDQRPGDNLYISSTIAIDVATGAIQGHFQYHPNDSWDWDEVSPPLLIDYIRDGRTIKGLVNVARNGYLWFLERADRAIRFVEGKPYVHQNVFLGLNPVTGRPEIDPERKPGTNKYAEFCPDPRGGKNWPPVAFSPLTRMIYIPANNNLCGGYMGVNVEYVPGRSYAGTSRNTRVANPGADHFGEVQAWNVDTGQRVWTHRYEKSPNWGSMLATAGGLVFTGGTSDRKIHAFDAATGKLLWEFPTPSGIVAPPTSFLVDGRQYIAVHSGWGGDARGMLGNLNFLYPGEYPELPEGGSVWVFALQ